MKTLYDAIKPREVEFQLNVEDAVLRAITEMGQDNIRRMMKEMASVLPGTPTQD